MATPRYQVAVGNIQNPYEGLSRSLSGLSKTFLDEAAREDALAREDARNAILDRRFESEQTESKRRFDAGQAIRNAQEQRALKEYNKQQSEEALRRGYSDFDTTALVDNLLTTRYKLTPEELQGKKGQQARDILSGRLSRTQVGNAIAQDYFDKTGKRITLEELAPVLSSYTDVVGLQTAADATAERDIASRDRKIDVALKAAGLLGKGQSGRTTTGGGSTGSSDLLGDTESLRGTSLINLYGIIDSPKEDFLSAMTTVDDGLIQEGIDSSARAFIIDKVKAKFVTGGNLDSFSNNTKAIEKYVDKLSAQYKTNRAAFNKSMQGFYGGMPADTKALLTLLSTKGLDSVAYRDIKQERQTETARLLDELFGRAPAAKDTSSSTSTKKEGTTPGSISDEEAMQGYPNRSDNTTSTTETTSQPGQSAVPNRGVIGPVSLPDRYNNVSINSLPADVARVVDLDWSGRAQPSNKKEKLTKDYLDARQAVLEATSKVTRNRDLQSEVPFVTNLKDKSEAKAEKAIQELAEIRRKLLAIE